MFLSLSAEGIRSTLVVAGELLGKTLKFSNFSGIITEVEAYIGSNDPACHAAKGYTKRTSVMFGTPGFSYVYFIYGMYYCLNIVTEKEGFPAAVLIRGLKLINPLELNLNGPGILCKKLNITKEHNRLDLTVNHEFCVYESDCNPNYICTPRIGISSGKKNSGDLKQHDQNCLKSSNIANPPLIANSLIFHSST